MAEELNNKLTWSVPEFIHYPKTAFWYVAVAVIGVIVFVISAFWLKDIIFLIIVVLAVGLLIYHGAQMPRNINVFVSSHGLDIAGHKSMSFDKLDGFSIYILHPEITKDFFQLVLHHKGKFHPYVKILVPHSEIDNLKSMLIRHLPELDYTESLVDHLGHVLRF